MSDTSFILTPEQAESLLPPGERVHSFVNPPWGFVGCDSSRQAVIRLIREAKLLEIGGERAKQMKHALVVHAREGGCKFFATDMEKVEAMERRLAGTTAGASAAAQGRQEIQGCAMKDAFDLWWEWATKTPESMLMIDGDIHYAVTELSPEDRRDRDKVNEAVRRYRESQK